MQREKLDSTYVGRSNAQPWYIVINNGSPSYASKSTLKPRYEVIIPMLNLYNFIAVGV
jgi:hypothetical protein